MRITDNILFNNFLYNINKINEKTYINNEKMASGKRLLDLASDPISLSKVLSLKDINMRFDQYVTNINSANAYLDAEDTALSNADDLLHKAGTLLVDGANSLNNDLASRTAIAENLDSIKDELIDSANTIFQGKYLFSGTKTDTKPIQTIQNEATTINITKDTTIKDIKIAADENFSDINQLDSGNYQIKIESGKLSLYKDDDSSASNIISIDDDSSDESDVGGNKLSNYLDLKDPAIEDKIKNGEWINTGRGLKIKIELNSANTDLSSISASLSLNYKSGGVNIYKGDDGKRNIEYSDKLTSPINITAKDIYKPTNQTLENDNQLIDASTQDPMTESSKLINLDLSPELAEAIQQASSGSGYKLQVGDVINIEGTDHNGNLVKGTYSIASSSDIKGLLSFIQGLDSTEVLKTNKPFNTLNGDSITGSTQLASINDTNIQNAIGSTLTLKGFNHNGTLVSTTVSLTSTTTMASIASIITSNFNASVSINHGRIEIEDNTPGDSSLKVYAYTSTSKIPIFSSFTETSKGGSGGFKDIEAKVEDGRIELIDKRPSDSKFNISFNLQDSSGSDKANIFGVFDIKTLGRGVDTFRTLDDASYALKNPYSKNQIGKPSSWQDISTFTPVMSGKYLGDKNDTWTVKVAKVANTSTTNYQAISENQIEDIASSLSDGQSKTIGMFQITDEEGKTVAVVGLKVKKISSSNFTYYIQTKVPSDPDKKIDFSKTEDLSQIDGTIIFSRESTGFSSASDVATNLINNLKDIVIQTKDAQMGGNFEGEVNGVAGVKINLLPPAPSGVPLILQNGDTFSFKLTNMVEQALGKVKDSLDQVLSSRSIVGARVNRFKLANERISYIKLSNTKTISKLEDANVADVFSEFKRNQIVMQATLEVGSKLTSQSLFDYLR
ncbi:flagellin [Hippea maritima]|uniref:Flagellin n=1 Tax=Hippea maritima (strain ATCC 700847 / DSM 10411 / MH2) TaxID=760142 RepID=F2LY21_HIPMA|nr:flagellin [Hippea maritima]AEA33286.1 flagellin domain protein [Hippea maritima DSM 10411]